MFGTVGASSKEFSDFDQGRTSPGAGVRLMLHHRDTRLRIADQPPDVTVGAFVENSCHAFQPLDLRGVPGGAERTPTLKPGDVLVMGNLGSELRRLLRAVGAGPLPPYSPDLNLIEQVFAKRRNGSQLQAPIARAAASAIATEPSRSGPRTRDRNASCR